jgi:hypothetical protein
MNEFINICMYACTHLNAFACMYTFIYIHSYMHTYVCIHKYMVTYKYIQTCTYLPLLSTYLENTFCSYVFFHPDLGLSVLTIFASGIVISDLDKIPLYEHS